MSELDLKRFEEYEKHHCPVYLGNEVERFGYQKALRRIREMPCENAPDKCVPGDSRFLTECENLIGELQRINEEWTGGARVWLETGFFQDVVKHFGRANMYLKQVINEGALTCKITTNEGAIAYKIKTEADADNENC